MKYTVTFFRNNIQFSVTVEDAPLEEAVGFALTSLREVGMETLGMRATSVLVEQVEA